MQKFLPIIVLLIAAIAGGGGGFFAKTLAVKPASADAEDGADSDGEAAADGHGAAVADAVHGEDKKKKKKGGHGEEKNASATTFMKFGRQFVVPVVREGRPKSMVILDINIEIDTSLEESIYTLEPRLRDALLTRLLILAGAGTLPQMLEDDAKMEATKAALLETSRSIIGDAAKNILILDIGIQSY
jgi:hypothetical protein